MYFLRLTEYNYTDLFKVRCIQQYLYCFRKKLPKTLNEQLLPPFHIKTVQTYSSYVYTPNKPYIRLIKLLYSQQRFQKKQFQYNMFLLPKKQFLNPNHIHASNPVINQQEADQIGICTGTMIQRCQILDSNLNIMIQQTTFKDLQKQVYCLRNQDDLNQDQLLEKTCNQFSFNYLSYPKHRDFHLGRQVREWKSMPFQQPFISRNHCKFIINRTVPRQGFILKICSKKARRNSLLKRVPLQLFNKIQQYLHRYGSTQYKIIDQHSTFGTYIYEIPSFVNKKAVNFPVKLQQNGSYSFNAKPQYFMQIEKIMQTKDFENYRQGVEQIKSWVKKQYQSKQKICIFVPKNFIPFAQEESKIQQPEQKIHFSFIKIRIQIFKKENYNLYHSEQKVVLIGTSKTQPFQFIFPIGMNLLQISEDRNDRPSIQTLFEQFESKPEFLVENDGTKFFSIIFQRKMINPNWNSLQNENDFAFPVPKRIGFLAYSGNNWYLCNKGDQLKHIKNFKSTFKLQKTYTKSFAMEYRNNGISQQRFSHIPNDSEQLVIWKKVPPIGIPLQNDRKYKIRLGTPKSGCVYTLLEFIDFEQE